MFKKWLITNRHPKYAVSAPSLRISKFLARDAYSKIVLFQILSVNVLQPKIDSLNILRQKSVIFKIFGAAKIGDIFNAAYIGD